LFHKKKIEEIREFQIEIKILIFGFEIERFFFSFSIFV